MEQFCKKLNHSIHTQQVYQLFLAMYNGALGRLWEAILVVCQCQSDLSAKDHQPDRKERDLARYCFYGVDKLV